MSICSNCYHRIKHRNAIEVGHLWNNEPFLGVVCSDKCKELCSSFGQFCNLIYPESKLYKSKTEQQKARNCQTDHLKQLQLDEFGYNYCEKCGKEVDIVELHHTLEVAEFGIEAINSAGHLLVCRTCHKEFTKKCFNK